MDEKKERKDSPKYLNYYRCLCGTTWEDKWDCTCDDRCPNCSTSITPYKSEDLSKPDEMDEKKDQELEKTLNGAKHEEFEGLSQTIIDIYEEAEIGQSIDRLDLDMTLSMAMNKTNRVDMAAYIDWGLKEDRSLGSILATVLHDLTGFKEDYLSEEPTGFCPRSKGYAPTPRIIITVRGGCVCDVVGDVEDIQVSVLDYDNEVDATEFSERVQLEAEYEQLDTNGYHLF